MEAPASASRFWRTVNASGGPEWQDHGINAGWVAAVAPALAAPMPSEAQHRRAPRRGAGRLLPRVPSYRTGIPFAGMNTPRSLRVCLKHPLIDAGFGISRLAVKSAFSRRSWPPCFEAGLNGISRPHKWPATLLKVLLRPRLRLTEFRAKSEPTTISAEIRPYSIAVTPETSLTSLLSTRTIGRLHLRFRHAQPRTKSLTGH
jgi:hypothetical protein